MDVEQLEDLVRRVVREEMSALSPILTTKQAARYCGLGSAQSLYNLISQGAGPKYFKHGRRNAFRSTDLDVWIESRLTSPDVSTY